MIYEVKRLKDLSRDRLLSLKNQSQLGPRQRVSGADLSSCKSKIIGGEKEIHPGCLRNGSEGGQGTFLRYIG
ncbi:hypothetical protein TNCV_327891 [Trichonephila clavipes]|nr:hypothetical protein TNCV_327891 [Trichonephila clavipes]